MARSVTAGLLAACALVAAAMGCAGPPDASRAPSSPAATPAPPAAAPPRAVTKLLVVVVENHSLTQMREGMPYTFSLAKRFGYATDYRAVAHPSLPNYLAIVSGQTFGIADDDPPSVHRLPGRTVLGQALDRGRTARVYAEGMQGNCATENQDRYAVKHNPWAYFTAERRACRAHDVPLAPLWGDVRSGRLPNVGMVVPDTCHDAHDCDLSVADGWVRSLMTRVFDGRDWRSGHLAVVVTADEDDRSEGNRVLTVVVHPSQRHRVVTERLDHYSLTRLYAEVAGTPYLAHARAAASMADAFDLPVG
jgi:hypothetical protein